MESFYDELKERLEVLLKERDFLKKNNIKTIEINGRINECKLAIVRVQQILLEKIK
mgnify:CR=1 FL=1